MVEYVPLAESAGGFRAPAFALEALSYLSGLDVGNGPFLRQVKFFGSASGDSFANLPRTWTQKTILTKNIKIYPKPGRVGP